MKFYTLLKALLLTAFALHLQIGSAQIQANLYLCEVVPGVDCDVEAACPLVSSVTTCDGQDICFLIIFVVPASFLTYTITIGQSGGGPDLVFVEQTGSTLFIRFTAPVLPGGSSTTFTLLSMTDSAGNLYDVSQSGTVQINVLEAINDLTIAQSGQACFTNPVTLTASSSGSGVTYSWSTGASGSTTTVNNTGQYTVTATNAAGCTATATTTVTFENTQPISYSLSGPVCSGNPITVTVIPSSSGFSYLWSTGSTESTTLFTPPGNLSITVTTPGGCTGTFSANYSSPLPSPSVDILGATGICPNQSITLSASGSFNTYNWSTGSQSNSISVNTAGTYQLTVSNASGCTGSATTTIQNFPTPSVTFSGMTEVCVGSCQDLTLNFTGTPPFNLTYTSPATGQQSQTFNSNTGILQICPPSGTPPGNLTVTAIGLTDLNCTCP